MGVPQKRLREILPLTSCATVREPRFPLRSRQACVVSRPPGWFPAGLAGQLLLLAVSEVRWAGFDRGWAFQRLSQSRPPEEAEEREMLLRIVERAPWAMRLLGRLAARRWERG